MDRIVLGHELLKQMELIVKQVQGNLEVAQDQQKSQADLKQTLKELQVGEYVFNKVRPKKSSLRLGICAKLAPRYCRPFEILSIIGHVAYQLVLPPNLKVHNIFHISVLKNYEPLSLVVKLIDMLPVLFWTIFQKVRNIGVLTQHKFLISENSFQVSP